MNVAIRVQVKSVVDWWLLACGVLAALTLAGCGGSGAHATAPVTGKVTSKGQPVTGGTLLFTPVASQGTTQPGKPASAQVGPDGAFSLSTYGQNDGAVTGRHRVRYSAPVAELPAGKEMQPGDLMPKSPFDGLVPKEGEVDVKKGKNEINIELVPPSGAAPASK